MKQLELWNSHSYHIEYSTCSTIRFIVILTAYQWLQCGWDRQSFPDGCIHKIQKIIATATHVQISCLGCIHDGAATDCQNAIKLSITSKLDCILETRNTFRVEDVWSTYLSSVGSMETSENISYCNFCLSKDVTASDNGGSFANCCVSKIMKNAYAPCNLYSSHFCPWKRQPF